MLGIATEFRYSELEWGAADFANLGRTLPYCVLLAALSLSDMDMGDTAAATMLAGPLPTSLTALSLVQISSLASLRVVCPSLKELTLIRCFALRELSELSALTSLEILRLLNCPLLCELPDLPALASLHTLELAHCFSLTALPDLSSLPSLREIDLRGCSSLVALPDVDPSKVEIRA